MTTRTTIWQSERVLCFSSKNTQREKLDACLAVKVFFLFSTEGSLQSYCVRAKPEFCAKVSEGEVEGVGGRCDAPPGGLDPHHPAGAICLQVQGKVAADGLHAVTQLLAQERVCKSNVPVNHKHKHAALVSIYRCSLVTADPVCVCLCASSRWISK